MILFRALGMDNDKAIAKLVWGTQEDQYDTLTASFSECADIKVYTRDDALEYLSHHLQYSTPQEDKKEYVRQLLETELLPHVKLAGDQSSPKILEARKAILISAMIRRLMLTNQGKITLDDRDSYPNKRVVSTGALLTHLFRQLFQKVCKDIRGKFVHEINNDSWKKGTPRPIEVLNLNNLYKILKVSTIEGKLKQALATGNFTVQGVGTGSTVPKIKFNLKSENYDNSTLGIGYSSLNTYGVISSGISIGDYFIIYNSNVQCGHALTGITTSSTPWVVVGTANTFIDGVYRAENVESSGVGIVTVTCSFNPGPGLTNSINFVTNTQLITNGFYGNYSWGKIYDYQNRALGSPKQFTLNANNGLIGLSTSPEVTRTRGLFKSK
jgi:hypothetical protein